MTRNVHTLYASYASHGIPPDLTAEEARSLAKVLMDEPAYLDHQHINHRVVAADVRDLYDQSTPTDQE